MNRVLSVVVTCLLLVALPLQGYAAAGMMFCDSGAATGGAVEQHHDGAAHHDGHATHQHNTATADVEDDGAPSLHDAMHGKCSVCSSCCSAAALPSASIAASAATPHAAPFPGFEHASPGEGPVRLERPPRLNLA